MTTILEYISANEERAGEMVAEAYRVVEVNDSTVVGDAITDLIHLAEQIEDINRDPKDDTDARRLALRVVETAVAHYLAEAHASRVEPEETSDALGGFTNPNVRIAQADDDVPLYDEAVR